jgi:hypothetical protein
MARELTAWMAMLALNAPARAWKPKRLRLHLFTAPYDRPAAAAFGCASPPPGSGLPRSPPRSAVCMHWHRLTSRNHPTTRRGDPRIRGASPTRRDSRAAPHGRALKISDQLHPQMTTSRSRNIQARDRVLPGRIASFHALPGLSILFQPEVRRAHNLIT